MSPQSTPRSWRRQGPTTRRRGWLSTLPPSRLRAVRMCPHVFAVNVTLPRESSPMPMVIRDGNGEFPAGE
jgi:hypothetical protein